VYDEQGRLDLIVADTRVATLDWGKDGVLAGAEVRSSYGEEGSGVVSLATTVAEK
jgi:hypothetical protein